MVGRPRDLDAYEQLVREHQGIAFRTAYVITGSAADAEEVAQDAFVKAHRALGRFREGSPLRPPHKTATRILLTYRILFPRADMISSTPSSAVLFATSITSA